MLDSLFPLFAPYQGRLAIRSFVKEDSIASDEDLQRMLETNHFVSLHQVHGNTTIIARSPSQREKDADGVVTDTKDLWLHVRTADCQSFVIYDPLLEVVGVLHAGWKGLVCGAIPSFFETMKAEWPIDASRILIGAGPSLCTACSEFTDPLQELPGIDSTFFQGKHVDLRAIADNQFIQCGIQKTHIDRLPDCTRCHPETYWSYRGGDRDAVRIKGARNILACSLL